MNHKFRIFVDAYIRAIGNSNHMEELSFSSTLIWPFWSHTLRFINHYALISWFPEPKLYSLQIKSEIRFQAKRFVIDSAAALDRIEVSFSSIQNLHKSSSFSRLLGEAMDAIEVHQQKLNQTIKRFEDDSYYQRVFSLSKRKEILSLNEHYSRGDRMRDCIAAWMEIIPMYENDSARLRSELRHFHASFDYLASFEISSQDSIAIPTILKRQIPLASCSWLRSSEVKGHNCGSTTSIHHYHLDMFDEADVLNLRSAIIQLCKERTNHNFISGSLYMICNIWHYAMTMSELDDDVLKSVQRSWVRERLEAIRRFEREVGADYEYLARFAVRVYQDFLHGTPVPEYLR